MSKETKFTKGEWSIIDNGSFFDIGPVELDDVYPSVCIWVLHRDEANAHLIKTAPKLYAMLVDILENEYMEHNRMLILEEVLAEARGEP